LYGCLSKPHSCPDRETEVKARVRITIFELEVFDSANLYEKILFPCKISINNEFLIFKRNLEVTVLIYYNAKYKKKTKKKSSFTI